MSSLNDFANLDKGIREVATLIPGATQETVDALHDEVGSLTTELGQSGANVTKAFYDGISAGIDPSVIRDVTAEVGKLTTATGSDIGVGMDLATTAMNAFDKDAEELTGVLDQMFATVQSGKTTLPELAASYSNVAAPAAALGVSIEETNAWLAALTLQGVPTAQASTQMRAAMNELADTGKGLGKVFSEVSGQSFKQFIADGGTTGEALDMIAQHATDTGQEIVTLAGSTRAAQAVMLATGTGSELMAGALDNISGSAGGVDEAFGIMSEGVAFKMAQTREAFNSAKESLGAFVAPIATEIMPTLVSLIDSLGPVIQALVGPLGKAISAVLPVVENLIDALAGPLETVLGAVGEAIAVLAETLGPYIVPIIETLAEVFATNLVVAIDTLLPIITQLIDILGPVLTDVIQKLAPIAMKLFEILGPMIGEMLTAVMPLISALADILAGTLMEVIGALIPVVNTLLEQLGPIIMEIITALVPIINNLAGTLGDILVEAIGVLMPVISSLLEELGPVIMEVLTTLMPVIGELVDILGDILLDAIETLMPIIGNLIAILGPPITDIIGILLPILNELMEAIGPAIQSVIEKLLPVIGDLLNELGPIITQVLAALMPILQSLGDLISTVLKVAFEDLLPPIIELLALILKGGSQALVYILEVVLVPALNLVSGVLETVIGWVEGFVGWIGDMITKVQEIDFGDIWDSIKDGFKGMVNAIINAWNSIDLSLGPWTIPSWIPGLGGKSFHIADVFPDIPLLAEGGIVTEPTMAMVGEGAADEAVVPLPDDWRTGGALGGDTINITINVEGSITSEDELFGKIEDMLNDDIRINSRFRYNFAKAS